MSNALDKYRTRILPFPARAVFDVRPEPGLARTITRDTPKRGRETGAAAIFAVLGGPYPEGAGGEEMARGGAYHRRAIDLEFLDDTRLSWRIERDIAVVLKMAEVLGGDVRGLPPDANLADIINAVARRLAPTTNNPNPPRLLLTIDCRSGPTGRMYFQAIAAAIVPPRLR